MKCAVGYSGTETERFCDGVNHLFTAANPTCVPDITALAPAAYVQPANVFVQTTLVTISNLNPSCFSDPTPITLQVIHVLEKEMAWSVIFFIYLLHDFINYYLGGLKWIVEELPHL